MSYKPGDIRKIGGGNGSIYVALAPNETHVVVVFAGEDGVPKFSIHLGDDVALGLAEAMTEVVKVAREIAAKRVWQ